MARRPVGAEGAARAALQHGVDRLARAAGPVQRSLVGALRRRRVEVDRPAAALAELADEADVVERVDGEQRVALGLAGGAALPAEPAAAFQLALDRDDPLGAFGVRAHV